MCGVVTPVAYLQLVSRAYVSNTVYGVHASTMSGAALFFTIGNVTAEDPVMQDGELGLAVTVYVGNPIHIVG